MKSIRDSLAVRSLNFASMCIMALGAIHVTRCAPLPPQAPTTIKILTKSVPDGIANAPYVSDAFEATGGKLPYTWDATGLPEGLSFGTSDIIHGRTTKTGTFSIVVTVTDNTKSAPLTAKANFKLTIGPPRK
jgi:hypothetical protein